jgi:PAS domain S-box-containing protein
MMIITNRRIGDKVMLEEWKIKGQLLQELDSLRSRIAQLEQAGLENHDTELKGLELTFRTIFDEMAEGILLAYMENKQFITGNKAICRMLGCSLDEITNLEITDVHPQEDLDFLIEQYEKHARGESTLINNIPVRRKDGSIFHADINSVPVTLAGKKYLMSIVRERPARKTVFTQELNIPEGSNSGKSITGSEMRVLRLIVKGMSNREIAQSLHRSRRTIEGHRAHLMQKLEVDNSVDLVRKAVAMGLIDLTIEQNST